GEALGISEGVVDIDDEVLELRSYGHGTDLISAHQNRIVLGFVRFVNGSPVSFEWEDAGQASLLDVRPIIEEYVEKGDVKGLPYNECMFVETGVRFKSARNYEDLDELDLAVESASYYRINSEGFMRIREEKLPVLVSGKDVGYRCLGSVTWYSAVRDKYYAVSIDSQGVPRQQIDVNSSVANIIEQYRKTYYPSGVR